MYTISNESTCHEHEHEPVAEQIPTIKSHPICKFSCGFVHFGNTVSNVCYVTNFYPG